MSLLETTRLPGSSGLTLAADVGGDVAAQAVIFLHGSGQTRHSWRRAAADLVELGYRVISYDARGHSDSDWSPAGDYSVDALVADLRAVIAGVAGKPVLVGASIGGLTALVALGEATVPLATGLIMVDIVPRMEPAGVAHIQNFMTGNLDGFATLDEAADAVARYNPHRPRSPNPAGLMKNLRLRNGRLFWHWDPRFIGKDFAKLDPMRNRSRLESAATRLRLPTLLVRGAQSDVVSFDAADEFRRSIPDCEFVDVPGAGHMVAGDRNDVFNRAVRNFLARHAPPLKP